MAKKKRSVVRALVLPLLFLAVSGVAAYYITGYLNRPRFVRYPAFGIDIPVNFSVHGIDVSHHQDNIDWVAVKAMQVKEVKLGFAFVKATEGVDVTDDNFRRNWFNARQAGITRGAYHFFNAGKSGKAQADNFISMVSLQKGDMPPVLDVEQTNGSSVENIQQRVKDWLDMVQAHYKVKPIIYTNIDFYENFLADRFNDYPLWIAHYLVQDKPRIKRNWLFWQYNEKGHVNGIDAYVDFNVFNGDSTDFRKLLVK